MKKSFGCLMGIAAALVLAVSPAQADIKVGIAGPLTGPTLNVGEQQEIGAQRAIIDLNAKGGVLGQRIIVTSVDDACDPDQAKAAAKQLVSLGVIFVVGHVCSGASLAASKTYEDAGIIMISPSSTNPKVTDEGGNNVFRVIGRDDQQGKIAGNFLADKHAGSRIAIIHDGQAYGMGLAEITRRQLNKRGVTEVMFDSFTAEKTDYSSLVDKMVAAKADVVYAGGYQGDIGIILRQAKQSLPNLQLLSGDALVNGEFLTIAGDAAVGTYFTFGPDIRLMPAAKSAVAAIREEDDYEPDGYTMYSYGAVQAWAQAVEQADSLKPDAVIAVLKSGSFDTVLGKIGFDDKGDVTGVSSFIWYKFNEEEYVPVE